jgi:hypothetical protein
MSTQSIQWHTKCLDSMRASLERKQAALVEARNDAERLLSRVNTLSAQIARATREGKAAFDGDKYRAPPCANDEVVVKGNAQ